MKQNDPRQTICGAGQGRWHGLARATQLRRTLLIAVACAPAFACVPSRHSAFSPVGHEVVQRTGYEVRWQQRGPESAKSQKLVDELLAAPLSLDAAIKLALINNRDLQADFENLGIGLAELADASSVGNPEMEVALRLPLSGDGQKVDLGAMQNVITLLSLPGRRNAANAELKALRMQATGAVIDLVAEIRIAFYRAQADQELLALRKTTQESAAASAQLMRALFQAGNVTELALAQEEVQLEEADMALAAAELQVITGREALHGLLGLFGERRQWTIEEPLADPVVDVSPRSDRDSDIEAIAVAQSVDLEGLRHQLRAEASRLGVARLGAWLPHVGAGVSAERELDGGWAVGPALSLEVPLFDRKQGALARSHAHRRQLQERFWAMNVKVRANARAAQAVLEEARARALRLRDHILPLRDRVLSETLKHYNAMSSSPFELLQAKRAQVASRAQFVESLYGYWAAQAELDRVRQGRMSAVHGRAVEMPSDASGTRAGH